MSATDWSDKYMLDEFVCDFKALRNKNGIPEDLTKIKNLLEVYVDKYKSHLIPQNIFDEYNDVTGDYIDIPRYIDGQPDNMIKFDGNKQKKSINIFFQAGGSACACEKIKLIGKIIYCLNNILKNRTINLYACSNTSNRIHVLVPIIISGMDVITPQIELILLNLKAFFRRIFFAIEESLPESVRRDNGIYSHQGYGQAVSITEDSIVKYFNLQPDILINNDIMSEDLDKTCKKLIESMVSALN
jgi:hypothetical protein